MSNRIFSLSQCENTYIRERMRRMPRYYVAKHKTRGGNIRNLNYLAMAKQKLRLESNRFLLNYTIKDQEQGRTQL